MAKILNSNVYALKYFVKVFGASDISGGIGRSEGAKELVPHGFGLAYNSINFCE